MLAFTFVGIWPSCHPYPVLSLVPVVGDRCTTHRALGLSIQGIHTGQNSEPAPVRDGLTQHSLAKHTSLFAPSALSFWRRSRAPKSISEDKRRKVDELCLRIFESNDRIRTVHFKAKAMSRERKSEQSMGRIILNHICWHIIAPQHTTNI